MLTPTFSSYLNGLRAISALMVVLFHIKKLGLGPEWMLGWIPNHGHDFVIVFFVLSGYLIAYSVDTKRPMNWRIYLLDRGSRIYPVAIAALLLSYLLSLWHLQLDAKGDFFGSSSQPVFTFVSNALFFSSAWGLNQLPFWNNPYWSLTFEVVYYGIFGVWLFAPSRYRMILLAVVFFLVGPKIILLLPCWIMGVLAYKYRDMFSLSGAKSIFVGFVAPCLILYMLHKIGFGPYARDLSQYLAGTTHGTLEWSKNFVVDYATSALVSMNLIAVRCLSLRLPGWLSQSAKFGADMSFSLYLFHQPFLYFVLWMMYDGRNSIVVFALAVIGSIFFSYVFYYFVECRRIWWRTQMARFIS